jgi:para-nitrobenzyl esterase
MKCIAAMFVVVGCSTPEPARAPVQPGPPTVETTEGRVIGRAIDGLDVYLGMPYASPPIGELRWKDPMPPPHHEPLVADKYRLACAQVPVPEGGDAFGSGHKIPSSEDCLYANVWVPSHAAGERLPVMVWIHGGQYVRGGAYQYDGATIARIGHVVVVTMDYRIGPMGFMAHPALTAESAHHASGNQALLDNVQGLRWLQVNLASFGGDPARVTLFGESAGSASTCALLVSPLGRGLFQRAILQSDACPADDDVPTLAEREKFGAKLSGALGCTGTANELACMRGKTTDEVLAALTTAKVFGDDGGGAVYRPVRDGYVLSETPEAGVMAMHEFKVPVMLGTTDNELGRYVVGFHIKTVADYRARIEKDWGKGAPALLELYPVTTDDEVPAQLAALYNDWGMTCPVRRDARAFVAAGVATYLYRYMHAPNILARSQGAFHGAELVDLFPSVFATKGLVLEPDDAVLTQLVVGYWARFAATGDPNGGGAPAWPRYDAATEQHLAIDVAPKVGARLRQRECDAWDRLGK